MVGCRKGERGNGGEWVVIVPTNIPHSAKAKVMGSAPLAIRPIVDDWSCPLHAVSMPLPRPLFPCFFACHFISVSSSQLTLTKCAHEEKLLTKIEN